MDNEMQKELQIMQIRVLTTILVKRGFKVDTSLDYEKLKSMDLLDLETIHESLHELAYAPPG